MTDFYGRPLRKDAPPASSGYFDSTSTSSYYPSELRDNNTPPRREDSSNVPKRSPTMNYDKSASSSNATVPDGVSPDLIAAIAEKVKKELLAQMKQTGSLDDQARAQPMQRYPSNISNSTSSPPPTARRVYTPPSPTQPVKQTNAFPQPLESMRSPPTSPLEKPGVRFSDRGFSSRPTAGRTYSTTELSTIDQAWGRLFDSNGNASVRLGNVLRGLANHIIDDFEPKKSIVVTPAKMSTYYNNHALDKEIHPLKIIFRAQQHELISRLYQDLGCEHHLVQEDASTAPTVPALTPVGFAQWMTINILAYPDEEAIRLDKVFLAMPVNADGDLVDGKPQRLPKQISRYLFPERYDHVTRKHFEDAIASYLDDLGSTNRRKASITSPPLSRQSSTSQQRARPTDARQDRPSPTTAKPNPLERERKPYSGTPATFEPSSNDDSFKIERDRAPYTAKEGSGKVHTENVNLNLPHRPGRSNSVSQGKPQPENVEPRHHRAPSNSTQGYMPPPRTRRPGSPPLKNFSQSTPSDIHNPSKYGPDPTSSTSSFANQSQTFNPSSYGSNSSFPPPPGPPPVDVHRRSKDDRQYRRDIDDDLRYAGDFTSPRDAEKWDRYQELRDEELDRFSDRAYERPTIPLEPRDTRGAPPDDWYRDKGRSSDFENYGRRY